MSIGLSDYFDQIFYVVFIGNLAWKKTDEDSVLVLTFHQKGKDAILKMAHVNVPSDQAQALKKGWDNFYWEPWKKYLTAEK